MPHSIAGASWSQTPPCLTSILAARQVTWITYQSEDQSNILTCSSTQNKKRPKRKRDESPVYSPSRDSTVGCKDFGFQSDKQCLLSGRRAVYAAIGRHLWWTDDVPIAKVAQEAVETLLQRPIALLWAGVLSPEVLGCPHSNLVGSHGKIALAKRLTPHADLRTKHECALIICQGLGCHIRIIDRFPPTGAHACNVERFSVHDLASCLCISNNRGRAQPCHIDR